MRNLFADCRRYMKMGVLLEALCVLLSASALILPSFAHEGGYSAIPVTVGEIPYRGRAVLVEDTTYIELGALAEELNPSRRSFDPVTNTAHFVGNGLTMTITDGAPYMEANGRYLYCEKGVFAGESGVYVPLRAAARAFGADVVWHEDTFSVSIVPGTAPILSGDSYYIPDEVYWLSRIIHAEAGAEPFIGQLAVGNVVLNRVRTAGFPDTIYSVIFDTAYGVQFTPVANGMIYQHPDADAVIAAKLCLEGYSVSEEILYFLNPRLAESFWVPQNRPYVMTISGHDFYS